MEEGSDEMVERRHYLGEQRGNVTLVIVVTPPKVKVLRDH